MTPSQKYLQKLGLKDQDADESNEENKPAIPENPRRSFLKKSALGGITLSSAFMLSPVEELIAQSTQTVKR